MPRHRMRPRWHKVLADLWEHKLRTLLVVASIAVGVFAIGVIAGTYVIISQDLAKSFRSINPANIQLITTPFEADDMGPIRRIAGVAEAEGRRQVKLRLLKEDGEWDVIELLAVPDTAERRINYLLPRQGQPAPGDHEVVLEHKTLDRLEAAIGDTIAIELSDGTMRHLTIAGTVLDQNAGYGPILGDLTGYVATETLTWLGYPRTMNRLLITVEDRSLGRQEVAAIAEAVTDHLEKGGQLVHSTWVSPGARHPLASILQALIGVLGILGVLIVFLSGSLISNTMSALLAQHLPQIGVMKLVGARRLQVNRMYMVLIMSFGFIALLIAIPLGSWGAYALARFAGRIVNFEMDAFRVVPVALVLQTVIALTIPPASGILPVLKGSRIKVQEAFTSNSLVEGKAAAKQTGGLMHRLRWLTKRGLLSRPMLLALRNTFRHKRRLVLTLFTLMLGGAIFIAVFNTREALNTKADSMAQYFRADVNLTLTRPYRIEQIRQKVEQIEGVERVEVWSTTVAEWQPEGDAAPETITVLAPPADSDLVEATILHGRWLCSEDQNAIAISDAFWRDYAELTVGDTLHLEINGQGDDWVVVGIFQYTGMDDLMAYANYDYLAELLHARHHASVFRIVTTEHSMAFQEKVSTAIDHTLSDRGYRVGSVQAGAAFVSSLTDMLGLLISVLLVMAMLTAIVGSIGLAGTMSMNVMERTREIGVMRAIGAHDRIVAQLVIVEGLTIGAMSYLLGALVSFPITRVLSNVISLAIFRSPATFELTIEGFLIWLAVVVGLSLVSSLIPMRNATRLTIRKVLAYE